MKKEHNKKIRKIFAVFVIYLFMLTGISSKVFAQDKEINEETKKAINDPESLSDDEWKKVELEKLPPEVYEKVKWEFLKEKIKDIKDKEKVTKLIAVLSKEENREYLKKLTAEQLQDKKNLENIGNLKDLDQKELEKTLKIIHNLPSEIKIKIGTGKDIDVIYKDGKLINRKVSPEAGISLDSLKIIPGFKEIRVVKSAKDPNINGFAIITKQGTQVITSNVDSITGFDIDENGNTVIHTKDNEKPIILKKGESGTHIVVDKEGNAVLVSSEGTKVSYSGFDFTAHGEKGEETQFLFKEGSVEMDGPGYISRGRDKIVNQAIEGDIYGKFRFSFGKNPGEFSIIGEKAKVRVGDYPNSDVFEGDFNAFYVTKGLSKLSLHTKGTSAQLRGHLKITNDGDIPKTYYTQYNTESKRIEQVWHNTVALQTYNEEKVKVNELKEDEVKGYIEKAISSNQKRIADIEESLKNEELNDIQKAQLEKELAELTTYNNDIKNIDSKQDLIKVIDEKIERINSQNKAIGSSEELKNTGIIEYYPEDHSLYEQGKKTTDHVPQRMVILPGKSSYGNFNSNTDMSKNDRFSFSGSQEGVYSIYSPPEYSKESGKEGNLKKRGFVYFTQAEDIKGDFGTLNTKTKAGIISIRTGLDDSGNSYSKIRRDIISLGQSPLEDSELILVSPSSKEPRTSMIRLDKDGIHAISRLVGGEKGEILTSASVIKDITDKFKRTREIAIDILRSTGRLTGEALERIQRIFATKFGSIDDFIREQTKGIPPTTLYDITKISMLKVDNDIEGLQNFISREDTSNQLKDLARQKIIESYESQGNFEEATQYIEEWKKLDPENKILQNLINQREQKKEIDQKYKNLQEKSTSQLENMLEDASSPKSQIYALLSSKYSQQGNYLEAQKYAELARDEFTLGLERSELDLKKAGYTNVFDFTEKAIEVNQRLAQTSLQLSNSMTSYNKEDALLYSRLAEDTGRFMSAVDKRNTNAAQIVYNSMIQQSKLTDNEENKKALTQKGVEVWNGFIEDNKDNERLKIYGELNRITAYSENGDYEKARGEVERIKDLITKDKDLSIEFENELKSKNAESLAIHAKKLDEEGQLKEAYDKAKEAYSIDPTNAEATNVFSGLREKATQRLIEQLNKLNKINEEIKETGLSDHELASKLKEKEKILSELYAETKATAEIIGKDDQIISVSIDQVLNGFGNELKNSEKTREVLSDLQEDGTDLSAFRKSLAIEYSEKSKNEKKVEQLKLLADTLEKTGDLKRSAEIYVQLDDKDKAKELIEKHEQSNKNIDDNEKLSIAKINLQTGNSKEGIDKLKELYKKDPKNTETKALLLANYDSLDKETQKEIATWARNLKKEELAQIKVKASSGFESKNAGLLKISIDKNLEKSHLSDTKISNRIKNEAQAKITQFEKVENYINSRRDGLEKSKLNFDDWKKIAEYRPDLINDIDESTIERLVSNPPKSQERLLLENAQKIAREITSQEDIDSYVKKVTDEGIFFDDEYYVYNERGIEKRFKTEQEALNYANNDRYNVNLKRIVQGSKISLTESNGEISVNPVVQDSKVAELGSLLKAAYDSAKNTGTQKEINDYTQKLNTFGREVVKEYVTSKKPDERKNLFTAKLLQNLESNSEIVSEFKKNLNNQIAEDTSNLDIEKTKRDNEEKNDYFNANKRKIESEFALGIISSDIKEQKELFNKGIRSITNFAYSTGSEEDKSKSASELNELNRIMVAAVSDSSIDSSTKLEIANEWKSTQNAWKEMAKEELKTSEQVNARIPVVGGVINWGTNLLGGESITDLREKSKNRADQRLASASSIISLTDALERNIHKRRDELAKKYETQGLNEAEVAELNEINKGFKTFIDIKLTNREVIETQIARANQEGRTWGSHFSKVGKDIGNNWRRIYESSENNIDMLKEGDILGLYSTGYLEGGKVIGNTAGIIAKGALDGILGTAIKGIVDEATYWGDSETEQDIAKSAEKTEVTKRIMSAFDSSGQDPKEQEKELDEINSLNKKIIEDDDYIPSSRERELMDKYSFSKKDLEEKAFFYEEIKTGYFASNRKYEVNEALKATIKAEEGQEELLDKSTFWGTIKNSGFSPTAWISNSLGFVRDEYILDSNDDIEKNYLQRKNNIEIAYQAIENNNMDALSHNNLIEIRELGIGDKPPETLLEQEMQNLKLGRLAADKAKLEYDRGNYNEAERYANIAKNYDSESFTELADAAKSDAGLMSAAQGFNAVGQFAGDMAAFAGIGKLIQSGATSLGTKMLQSSKINQIISKTPTGWVDKVVQKTASFVNRQAMKGLAKSLDDQAKYLTSKSGKSALEKFANSAGRSVDDVADDLLKQIDDVGSRLRRGDLKYSEASNIYKNTARNIGKALSQSTDDLLLRQTKEFAKDLLLEENIEEAGEELVGRLGPVGEGAAIAFNLLRKSPSQVSLGIKSNLETNQEIQQRIGRSNFNNLLQSSNTNRNNDLFIGNKKFKVGSFDNVVELYQEYQNEIEKQNNPYLKLSMGNEVQGYKDVSAELGYLTQKTVLEAQKETIRSLPETTLATELNRIAQIDSDLDILESSKKIDVLSKELETTNSENVNEQKVKIAEAVLELNEKLANKESLVQNEIEKRIQNYPEQESEFIRNFDNNLLEQSKLSQLRYQENALKTKKDLGQQVDTELKTVSDQRIQQEQKVAEQIVSSLESEIQEIENYQQSRNIIDKAISVIPLANYNSKKLNDYKALTQKVLEAQKQEVSSLEKEKDIKQGFDQETEQKIRTIEERQLELQNEAALKNLDNVQERAEAELLEQEIQSLEEQKADLIERSQVITPLPVSQTQQDLAKAAFTGVSSLQGAEWNEVYETFDNYESELADVNPETAISEGNYQETKINIEYNSESSSAEYDAETDTITITTTSSETDAFVKTALVHEIAEAAYRKANPDASDTNAHAFSMMAEATNQQLTQEERTEAWQGRELQDGKIVDTFTGEEFEGNIEDFINSIEDENIKKEANEALQNLKKAEQSYGVSTYPAAKSNLKQIIDSPKKITSVVFDIGSKVENERAIEGMLKYVNDNYGHGYGDIFKQAFYEVINEQFTANKELSSPVGTKGLEARIVGEVDIESLNELKNKLPGMIVEKAKEINIRDKKGLANVEEAITSDFTLNIGIATETISPTDNIEQKSDSLRYKASVADLYGRSLNPTNNNVQEYNNDVNNEIIKSITDGTFAQKYDAYILVSENPALLLKERFESAVIAGNLDSIRAISNEIKDASRLVPRINPLLSVMLFNDVIGIITSDSRLDEILNERGKKVIVGKSATGEELIATGTDTVIVGDIDRASDANAFTMQVQALFNLMKQGQNLEVGSMNLGSLMDRQGIDAVTEKLAGLEDTDLESLNRFRQNSQGLMSYMSLENTKKLVAEIGFDNIQEMVQEGRIDSELGLMNYLIQEAVSRGIETSELSASATAVSWTVLSEGYSSEIKTGLTQIELELKSKNDAIQYADEITSKVGKDILGRNTIINVLEAKINSDGSAEFSIEYHNSETTTPQKQTVVRDVNGDYQIKYESDYGREKAIEINKQIDNTRQTLEEC